MKAEKLFFSEIPDFLAYCKRHRDEVDDSFLLDADLEAFVPDGNDPTFVIKSGGKIIAVASLILDDFNRRIKNGRFRIFHSERSDVSLYSALLTEVLRHTEGLDKFTAFVPLTNTELTDILEQLHFTVSRYLYFMVRALGALGVAAPFTLPDGFQLKPFEAGKDEEAYRHIRNTAFTGLKGASEINLDDVLTLPSKPDYIEGGILFLMHEGAPVGVVRGSVDEYEGESVFNIGPLAVLPEYQGRGLGRQLIRAAVGFAVKLNYKKATLSVNAENENAKGLYLKEGFAQTMGFAAYEYRIEGAEVIKHEV